MNTLFSPKALDWLSQTAAIVFGASAAIYVMSYLVPDVAAFLCAFPIIAAAVDTFRMQRRFHLVEKERRFARFVHQRAPLAWVIVTYASFVLGLWGLYQILIAENLTNPTNFVAALAMVMSAHNRCAAEALRGYRPLVVANSVEPSDSNAASPIPTSPIPTSPGPSTVAQAPTSTLPGQTTSIPRAPSASQIHPSPLAGALYSRPFLDQVNRLGRTLWVLTLLGHIITYLTDGTLAYLWLFPALAALALFTAVGWQFLSLNDERSFRLVLVHRAPRSWKLIFQLCCVYSVLTGAGYPASYSVSGLVWASATALIVAAAVPCAAVAMRDYQRLVQAPQAPPRAEETTDESRRGPYRF